jgi:hypothetical protein
MCVPLFTVAPSITGTAKNGQVLTGASGTVARGTVTSRQWKRNGVAIAGATAATYTVQAADIGAVITLTVLATNGLNAANTASATSAPTATVIA